MPPALSAIGPNASIASCIPVVANIPTAAIATPYKPADLYAMRIAALITKIGPKVEIIPTLTPAIIFVAEPVVEACAIRATGLYFSDVKYSVNKPTKTPAIRPLRTEINIP